MSSSRSAADSPAAPEVLVDRYQLLERIGEGGMGVVWRGFDMDLEEPVAIKFLREDLASDETLRTWFRREVKLARRVTHANVARVYEFGRDGTLYFLTMEFVEGASMAAMLDQRGSLPAWEVLPLAVSLCRGLAAAHAVGVVHGDIKPANILLAPGRGAVLTDFGIARVLSEAHVREETSRGTPIYMAPEQLLSSASTLQSDVYAVGVMLFEALTGTVPWVVKEMLGFLEQKCHGSAPDLRTLAPDLPLPWLELIEDCLQTDPAGRPADARALLTRLAGMRLPDLQSASSGTRFEAPLASADTRPWLEVVPLGIEEEVSDVGALWPGGKSPTATGTPDRALRIVGDDAETNDLTRARGTRVHVGPRSLPAPDLPLARLGRTLARVTTATLFREPSQFELAELRRQAEQAVAEHDELGESHLIMAGVLLAANQPVTAAQSAAKAIRRAPSLVAANAFVGEMLCEVGRLPEAERRLDVALALDRGSIHAWLARARLLAYHGRWDDLFAVIQGRLAALRFRTVHALRLLLWRRDPRQLAQLAQVLADNRDQLPASLLQDTRDVVDFALERGDRRELFERLAGAYPPDGRSCHTRSFALILCEMACLLGDLDRARELLRLADDLVMYELHWLESCPTIEPLRGDPGFAEIRRRVRARAEAITKAIWV